MAKAIEAGLPKMRIEEAAARTQARIDAGAQTIVGVNKFQVTDQAEIEVLKVDNTSVRESQIAKLQRLKGERDAKAVAAALEALTEAARTRRRQPAGAGGRGGARQGHGRRDLRRPGEGVGPASRRVARPCPASTRRRQASHEQGCRSRAPHGRGVRRQRRPAAAHPGRQDGPGRPRPRPEGDRLRLRRPGLRRRHRPAVPDARRDRAPGGRERRAHRRRVLAGRRPPDAGAGADGGAREGRPRRHHDRGRRRHPAAGLRRAVRGRRQGRVRPWHQHPRRGRGPARQAQRRSWATGHAPRQSRALRPGR